MTQLPSSAERLQFAPNAVHDRGRIGNRFVLPDSEHMPSVRGQSPCGLDITFPIAKDLPVPVLAVGPWSLVVLQASVPETAIDEDRESRASEHDIRSAPKGGDRAEVDSVPEPVGMQKFTYQELRGGVAALVGLHAAPICFGRRPGFDARTHRFHSASPFR